jgi:hypothetical protein
MAEKLTSFRIALETQHNLWRTVPSRSNIFSHVSCILLGVNGEASCQPEITDLQLAIRVNQQVSGLQIAMKHIGRVDVLQSAQDLVDEGLEVGIGEGLSGSDNGCEIALHELYNDVRLTRISPAHRLTYLRRDRSR